ncbi:MAG: DUF1376 domain-containing protein [Candidatus Diapherotrites archaeon]|nr:DUF1376 domain-containing protein [Candidatus Diapherotrites archaeon]
MPEKKKGKAPAVQIYTAEFYADTAGWSVTEVGIYWRLLMNQWDNKELPPEMSRLARIAGCDVRTFNRNWQDTIAKKFVTTATGGLQNYRLETSRKEYYEFVEQAIESGSKGGKVTQQRRRENIKQPLKQPLKPKQSPSSSSSSLKPLSEATRKMTNHFLLAIRRNNPKHLLNTMSQKDYDKKFYSWAKDINKILNNDKRTEEDTIKVIAFATTDSFWKSNILSAKKLRDKFDTLLSKIETKNNAPEKINFSSEWQQVLSCFNNRDKLKTLPDPVQKAVRQMQGLSEIGRQDERKMFFKYMDIRKAMVN